ncbi:S1C family serine protease [Faecalicatena contorta]|uniref:S1C family serine protease n=1 Tax=Faecalicatena contorta TaxID=39482 RepID=UPI001F1D819D|nr:PDZ domain-containing protein [Faecalicatena contorta]MCF2554324.1 PDZ domain-containing protein [Faecalicatena contorta]
MDEQKRPVDEQEPSEEEYSFLQEVIKDEADRGKKFGRQILRMAILGLAFGLLACVGFYIGKPWVEGKMNGGPEQITIPADEEEEPDSEEKAGQEVIPDERSYQDMLQVLKSTAEKASASVVEICIEEEWHMAGTVVGDNGRELLVLGKKFPDKMSGKIYISFSDGARAEASIKRKDSNLDLAVYAVPREAIENKTWSTIQAVEFGNSNIVSAGDIVIVLGRTAGNDYRISYGMVEKKDVMTNYADGQYGVICTDITGTEEESGLILNMEGEAIGIVSPSMTKAQSDMHISGFCISDVKDAIERLSNGKGVPYTGIRAAEVTEEMQEQGFPKGISVTEAEADSPAMAAGIQSGDIITEIDGVEIENYTAYHHALMKKEEGDSLELRGCRQGTGGEYVDIDFTVRVGTKE